MNENSQDQIRRTILTRESQTGLGSASVKEGDHTFVLRKNSEGLLKVHTAANSG